MMNFAYKKSVLILAFLSLAACDDPNAEIKELNANELNGVKDTLYIEKTAENSTPENPETAVESPIAEIENQVDTISSLAENIEETPEQTTSSTASIENILTDASNQATARVDELESELIEAKDNPIVIDTDTETATENSNEALISEISNEELIAQADNNVVDYSDAAETNISSNFSKPTTQSETPSELVLKDLLANFEAIDYVNSTISEQEKDSINAFCKEISSRLSSVSLKGCLASNHRISPFRTVEGRPIVITEFAPKAGRTPLGKILVIGGTHGDELTSVSTAYKWIANLNKYHTGLFHWHIAPALNADGVLKRPATRPNHNGVDINRNLPTPDWEKQSTSRWEKLNKNLRKNPGTVAASEPESKWIMHEIATFQPDAIVSIHAPYGLLDFDSPQLKNAPKSFGRLQLNLLGTYPGSLGNYAGIQRQIPVLTLELPNATAMPSQKELAAIWSDMIKWLQLQLK